MYNRPRVFLSYNWSSKEDADSLERDLSAHGVLVTRDVNDLSAWGSLQAFMQSIREHDFTVLLISEEYLYSENCMYEALQALSMDNYQKRIFPIVLNNKIYSPFNHLLYSKYWADKCVEFRSELIASGLDLTDDRTLEAKKLQSIRDSIAKLLVWITDTSNPSIECAADKIVEFIIHQCPTRYSFNNLKAANNESEGFPMNYYTNQLINWHFCNPINQRNQKTYTVKTTDKPFSGQYTIDRWYLNGMNDTTTTSIVLRDNGIECRCFGTQAIASLSQPLEYFEMFAGKNIVISAEISEYKGLESWLGISYSTSDDPQTLHYERASIQNSGISFLSFQLPHNITRLSAFIMFANEHDNDKSYLTVESIKLEISNESSLIKDSAPIYHEELAKCQRYGMLLPRGHIERAVACSRQQIVFKIALPIALRTSPVLTSPQDHILSCYPDFFETTDKTRIIDTKYESDINCLYFYVENVHSWQDATLTLSSDVFFDCEIY